MANKRTMEQARKEARARLVREQQDKAERDRKSVDDAARIVLARTRAEEVDEWQAKQVAAVAVEADRKRREHQDSARLAVERMRERGDTIKSIATLAGVSEGEIRKLSRLAPIENIVAPTSDTDGCYAGALGIQGEQVITEEAKTETVRESA
ncbi:Uncharacterised protein [Mycobacteroides abscessus subsp. bolletii]|uniref:hypothetical protein n=1 Tax=Mycobacteroides abscessus TaxID=36809 RepID=UPI0009A5E16A|nr:hypothetical protein [Mycobacteroides abscessus]SKS73489.1 Uncharacterised protein [Mycobacteroides abscessus subsp. bolletii]SKS83316.1 Uncharacterised protein [Mycobacteroides abscessus subsp. bolletii]